MGRVGQWFGRAGPCRAGPAPRPLTSISQAQPSQTLTFIDRAWASPAPKPLTFIDRALGQPGPQPLTSIGQTPHFSWPDPSLLLAKSGRGLPNHIGHRTMSGGARTVPDRAMPILAVSPCQLRVVMQ